LVASAFDFTKIKENPCRFCKAKQGFYYFAVESKFYTEFISKAEYFFTKLTLFF